MKVRQPSRDGPDAPARDTRQPGGALQRRVDASARVAAQSSRVSQLHAAPGTQTLKPLPSPGAAMPLQAKWEYVDVGGRERRYNLRDNGDGTHTHGATGEVYHHVGNRMHSQQPGVRVLTPVNAPVPASGPVTAVAPTTAHDPKNVLFEILESGKVNYLANTAAHRQQYAGKYIEMKPEMFSTFKNAGKRYGSSKVMDPVTLARYSYDDVKKLFHEWDPAKGDRRGQAVSTVAPTPGGVSANQALLDRLAKGELVDRRRAERTGENLSPFDVGSYATNVALKSDSGHSRNYQNLKNTPAWLAGSAVNRDHAPSGESQNVRGDPSAYNQAFAITIPNPEMHQVHSPTFGTDNSHKNGLEDDMEGTTDKRVELDAKYPALAFYRDAHFMLTQTEGQDYSASASHAWLDLSKPRNRVRQVGGYRNLHRRNTQIHKRLGAKRGFDPASPAYEFAVQPRIHKKKSKKQTQRLGIYKYSKVPKKTQGALAVERYIEHLIKTGEANMI